MGDFLDEFNCYTANIRCYKWLTAYRNHIKKNTSKLGFQRWTNDSSALLYSDFLLYLTHTRTNISSELLEIINDSNVINRRKLIFDITKKTTFRDLPNEDSLIYGDTENQITGFSKGDVTRINFVELEDDEFKLVSDYLIKELDKSHIKDNIIIYGATHPASGKKILMITENSYKNANEDGDELL